ncbi:MAG: hypothetical protein DCC55_39625 [Chloroflexi bacterium]|nr:MAG: hypothetical protein DCC55_39625 [Chloroflexota bacterium]
MQRALISIGVSLGIALLGIATLLISNGLGFTAATRIRHLPQNEQTQTNHAEQPPLDSEAPAVPTNLGATHITLTAIALAWDAATDDVGVAGYRLYERVRANPYLWLWLLRVDDIPSPTVTVADLAPGSQHRYAVSAFDLAGNESAKSAILHLYTYQAPQAYHPLSDGENIFAVAGEPFNYTVAALGVPAPTFTFMAGPTGMTVEASSGLVSWLPGADDVGIITATVRAANIAGVDDHTFSFPVHPAGTDLTPPGPVTQLAATDVTEHGATLTWGAATDNVGVAGYRVIAQLAGHGQSLFLAGDTGAPVTTFTVTTLQPATSYRLWVAAYDAAGNIASISGAAPVQLLTLGTPSTTPTATATLSPTAVPTLTPTETPSPTGTATPAPSVQIRIAPTNPSASDIISITVAGVHPNNCTPHYERHEVAGNLIQIESAPSDEPFCLPAEFPWEYTVTVGTLAAGDYTVTHTLEDMVTHTFFTVSDTEMEEPIPPYIYTGDGNHPITVTAGALFSYTIEVDGVPKPTLVLVEAPPGMSLDLLSGALAWTPPLEASPVVTVTVRAVNSVGSDEHTFLLHIWPPEISTEGPERKLHLPLIRR